jgi:energy-coupling factor transport system ATP-binding protein
MNIQIKALAYTYPTGVSALHGVSLTIKAGERVAIVGQNGSGKTTLAKHLNGLLRPSQGTVQIGDWLTTDHSVAQLARRVAYLFQNPDEQLCKRTVYEEVQFGPTNLRFPPAQREALVQAALAQLELTALAQTNPYDLTLTGRKRVALAAVLAMDTPIVVLDEPTTGQDHPTVQRFAAVIEQLQAQGKTVIAISHDIDFVAEYFPRVIVMRQGQVVLDGTPATIFGETDVLHSTDVEPPQLTRLGARLGLPQAVCNADEFLAAFAQLVK